MSGFDGESIAEVEGFADDHFFTASESGGDFGAIFAFFAGLDVASFEAIIGGDDPDPGLAAVWIFA